MVQFYVAVGVTAAYVTAISEGPNAPKELVAAITPLDIDINGVMKHCRNVLPSAAVPLVQPVSELKRLPSGKVDVMALGLSTDIARAASRLTSGADDLVSLRLHCCNFCVSKHKIWMRGIIRYSGKRKPPCLIVNLHHSIILRVVSPFCFCSYSCQQRQKWKSSSNRFGEKFLDVLNMPKLAWLRTSLLQGAAH